MNKLTDNIADLIKVKTIVTLVVMVVFAILSLRGSFAPELIMTIITMVVSFYFGTQNERREQGDKERTVGDENKVEKKPELLER